MGGIVVRPARPDEFQQIGDAVVAAYRTLPGLSEGEEYDAVLRDVAHRAVTCVVLAAELDGELVGTATYVPGPGPYEERHDPEAGSIRMVGVLPEARGRGVGKALVEACIAEARASGRARVRLSTRTVMATAQGMYERLGFRREPDDDWSPVEGIDLLGYVLELSPP